ALRRKTTTTTGPGPRGGTFLTVPGLSRLARCCRSRPGGAGGDLQRLDLQVVEVYAAEPRQRQRHADRSRRGDLAVEHQLLPLPRRRQAHRERLAAGAVVEEHTVGRRLDRRRDAHPAADAYRRARLQAYRRAVRRQERSLERDRRCGLVAWFELQ